MNSFKKVSKNHENQLQLDKCNWILKQNVTIEQILILQDHRFTSRWQFIQFASYRISLWKPFKVSLNLKSPVPMFSWILMWGVFFHGFSWAIEWLGIILKILSKNILKFKKKLRLAHKIDDSTALLVLEFQMPHFGSIIHNKFMFIRSVFWYVFYT